MWMNLKVFSYDPKIILRGEIIPHMQNIYFLLFSIYLENYSRYQMFYTNFIIRTPLFNHINKILKK